MVFRQGSRYTRPLSLPERSHLVFDRISPPLVNQMVFEGGGTLDLSRWKSAVEKAAEANPGSRLILTGVLAACQWVDSGMPPPVREVDGSSWNGFDPEGAPFLKDRLSPSKGPTCEVIIVHGNPARVIFRTHHGVMDGRGTMFFAEEVFRALRKEPLKGSASRLTDFELARSFQTKYRTPFPRDCLAPTGKANGSETGTTWRRVQVKGGYPHLISQLAVLTAQEAWRHRDGKVWIMLPIDLRSRKSGLLSTANLTLPIYIEVKPDTTPKRFTVEIAKHIKDRRDGMIDKWDHLFRYVPLWLLHREAKKIIVKNRISGLFSFSALLAHMGNYELTQYSYDAFQTSAIFGVNPHSEYTPFHIGIVETQNKMDITLSIPFVLASEGRIEAALSRMVSSLKPVV